MRALTAERISREISEWTHQGLIDEALGERLAQRYDSAGRYRDVLMRWLGFFALFLLGSSILGVLGLALGELAEVAAPVVMAMVSGLAWTRGARMAADPLQRYPLTGQILLTAGLLGALATGALINELAGIARLGNAMPVLMMAVAVASVATAYRFGLRWPLVLGLLLFFHGLGNWHAYAGHGGYWMGIRDERLTLVAGLAVALLGDWHERRLESEPGFRQVGFGHHLVIWGLLYLNLSLWFLSLHPGGLAWVLAFTAAGIGQIVVGGALHDSRWTGFGVVFLAIDLYTRFFERFWDESTQGLWLLLAGLAGMALGAVFEWRAPRGEGAA